MSQNVGKQRRQWRRQMWNTTHSAWGRSEQGTRQLVGQIFWSWGWCLVTDTVLVCRLEWETAVIRGSHCFQALEEERLQQLKDLAACYLHHLQEMGPKLVQVRCFVAVAFLGFCDKQAQERLNKKEELASNTTSKTHQICRSQLYLTKLFSYMFWPMQPSVGRLHRTQNVTRRYLSCTFLWIEEKVKIWATFLFVVISRRLLHHLKTKMHLCTGHSFSSNILVLTVQYW